MEGAVLFGLLLLAIPFVLPIISWVMARRARQRIDELDARIALQDDRITTLSNQITLLKKEGVAPLPFYSAREGAAIVAVDVNEQAAQAVGRSRSAARTLVRS